MRGQLELCSNPAYRSKTNPYKHFAKEPFMRNCRFQLLGMLFAAFVLTGTINAQSDPPPGCCGKEAFRSSSIVAAELKSAQLVISADAPQSLGISRSEFVDRLSAAFFPGKRVDLVISSTSLLTQPDIETSTAGEAGLMALQQKRFYRIPRSEVHADDMDGLRQVYITDGQLYVRVTFIKGDMLSLDQ
jgi:hypothetical protein